MPNDKSASASLQICGLPAAWAGRDAWTVLDTRFQDEQRFLETSAAWRNDPRRPRMLHYVGIAAQYKDFEPGFHRVFLDQGAVSLTICVGPLDVMLGEHVFLADTLYGHAPRTKWEARILARRCRRGAGFCLSSPLTGLSEGTVDPPPLALLRDVGFQLDGSAIHSSVWSGRFDPKWEMPTSRNLMRTSAPTPARCAIIGAGIAGASVAYAMALRGWQVTVMDQEAAPAGGASSLPAGLAVPHVSADDSPRSRITRRGIRLMEQYASQFLVKGQDWAPSGVLEQRPDGTTRMHQHAAWIKPSRIVQAWLSHTGITFIGNTKIATLDHSAGLWSLIDMQGQNVGEFEVVVVANAMGCNSLLKNLKEIGQAAYADILDKLFDLQAIHGTLSHGHYMEEIAGLPATPVNGNGCFIPHVPDAAGERWCAGSTFEPDALAAADVWGQHASNMNRLQYLLPTIGQDLAQTLARAPVSLWSATRCVTHDRLPLVGPVGRNEFGGLWLCIGLGSRGLSFSALCAELLVARLCAEPLPLEFSLSRNLDANRVRRKRKSPGAVRPAG